MYVTHITHHLLCYSHQLEKLVTAIAAIEADLLRMLELENDFGAAEGDDCTLKTLVDAVNLRVGADTSLMSGLVVNI
jgi:predicted extracellular nuclease